MSDATHGELANQTTSSVIHMTHLNAYMRCLEDALADMIRVEIPSIDKNNGIATESQCWTN